MTLPQPDIPRNVERLKKEAKRKEAFERMTPVELEAFPDPDTSDDRSISADVTARSLKPHPFAHGPLTSAMLN